MQKKTIRILWVEEETHSLMSKFKAYIDSCREYLLQVVDNLEEAIILLKNEHSTFEIILIDIRIYENKEKKFEPLNQYGLDLVKLIYSQEFGIHKVKVFTNEIKEAVDFSEIPFPSKNYFLKQHIQSIYDFEEKILNYDQHFRP